MNIEYLLISSTKQQQEKQDKKKIENIDFDCEWTLFELNFSLLSPNENNTPETSAITLSSSVCLCVDFIVCIYF